jgi:acetyl esterase
MSFSPTQQLPGPDPQLLPAFDRLAKTTRGWWSMSMAESRRALREMTAALNMEAPAVEMVIDGEIPGWRRSLATRVYRPLESSLAERLPVVLYLAGGSYTSGSIDLVEPQVRTIANGARCLVVAVEYGRAPEHKFPEPQEDCRSAAQWVFDNIEGFGGDPDRVALVGDGNGGELALSVAVGLRDRQGPQPTYLGLLTPLIQRNLYRSVEQNYRSSEGYPDAAFLRAMIDLCVPAPGHDMADDLRVNPMAAETLAGLPPTIMVTGAIDPAHHLDRAAVARMTADGVPVRFLSYRDQCPGSPIWAGVVETGRTMLDDLIAGLAEAFGHHQDVRRLKRQRLRVVE